VNRLDGLFLILFAIENVRRTIRLEVGQVPNI